MSRKRRNGKSEPERLDPKTAPSDSTEPGTTPLLDVQHLNCSIGDVQILSRVSFHLQRGEIIGLIGPNGSGKSTLLKCILGFLSSRSGSIRVLGDSLDELSHRRRAERISYVAQDGPGDLSFSAVEVVEMGSYRGIGRGVRSSDDDRALAEKALDYVGLRHIRHRHFNHLSGGERQLVLFARLLMQNTPVLLLDEPTSNLDIGHENTLLEMVEELTREGRGAVIAIHNLNLAAEYCSRLILLDGGRVVSQGDPSEVLTREHIESAYSTRVMIGRNKSSGAPSVHPVRNYPQGGRKRFHIIGGAGSGINITRLLIRRGIQFSAGIAHRLDSDAELWNSLDIPLVEIEPFSEIDDESFSRAKALCREADYTVLCSFPVGRGNLRNLELASHASRLIIMDDSIPETESTLRKPEIFTERRSTAPDGIAASGWSGVRTFHDPRGEALFRKLKQEAVIMNYSRLSRFLDSQDDGGFL